MFCLQKGYCTCLVMTDMPEGPVSAAGIQNLFSFRHYVWRERMLLSSVCLWPGLVS